MVDKRNPWLWLVLSFVTFGIGAIYWMVKTKTEINSLGAKIPTAWFLIIPLVNFYWMYKYAEGFATYVKKGESAILWFILFALFGPIALLLVQMELNKKAK